MNLKRQVGPLPLWGWIVLGGGGIGLIVLVKKSKAGSSTATESEPIPSNLAGPLGEGAGVGTGGGGAGAPSGEAKTPEPAVQLAVPQERTPVSEFLTTLAELEAGGFARPAPSGSGAPGASAALQTARGGPVGRGGLPYKPAKYKGMNAHEYPHAVAGGVGPGHRFVILPIGKKGHAKKPKHEHHAAKPHPHKAKPHAPHRPTVHTHKPHRHAAHRR